MKKILFWLMVWLGSVSWLHAHTLVLLVSDEGDGNILIKGEFSTGQLASGALVQIKALGNAQVLHEARLAEDGEMVVPIPGIPYEIVLDGGPGHTVSKEGIAPPGGFKQQTATPKVAPLGGDNGSCTCSLSHIFWALSVLMFSFVLFFGIKNITVLKQRV